MQILITEDDDRVSNFLKENLQKEHHSVTVLKSFTELENFLFERPFIPNLFILDRLLGQEDSKTLLKKVTHLFPTSPILILSALNSPREKASLIDDGADDYLGKPFSLVELQARVKALLRRNSTAPQNQSYLSIGDSILDIKNRTVTCNGIKLEVTNKEFALLLNFCENKSRVFTKYQLLDLIWESNLDLESNVIEVNIMNLRKKMERVNSNLKILSKRNVGYWLET